MSCETNKVTVMGGLDIREHGRHDHHDRYGRDFDALRDLIDARDNGEAHRDIIEKVLEVGQANLRETLEAKFAGVKETVEAKAAVLAAIGEAKHEAAVRALEAQVAFEKGLREILCRPRERGCGDH